MEEKRASKETIIKLLSAWNQTLGEKKLSQERIERSAEDLYNSKENMKSKAKES